MYIKYLKLNKVKEGSSTYSLNINKKFHILIWVFPLNSTLTLINPARLNSTDWASPRFIKTRILCIWLELDWPNWLYFVPLSQLTVQYVPIAQSLNGSYQITQSLTPNGQTLYYWIAQHLMVNRSITESLNHLIVMFDYLL